MSSNFRLWVQSSAVQASYLYNRKTDTVNLGSDLLLVDLVKNALERADRPTRVLTDMFTDPKMNY